MTDLKLISIKKKIMKMIIDSFDLNNLLKCPVDQCHPGSRKSFKNPSVFIPFYVEIMRYIGGSTDN